MTIIIEFILSLLSSLVIGPLVALMEVLSSLLVLVVELVFLMFRVVMIAIFKGPAAAQEFYRSHRPQFKRKKWGSQSSGIQNESATGESGSEAPQVADTPNKVSPIFLLISLILILGVGTFVWFDSRVRVAKINQTRAQVKSLADGQAALIRQNRDLAKQLDSGFLEERDAWNRAIEFSIDRFPIGILLVFRSAGPDGKPGTSDDLIAVRAVSTLNNMGGERFKKTVQDLIAKKLGEWFEEFDLDKVPIDWGWEE